VCSSDLIILDAFAGSGTTIIAAEHVSRRCFAIELDPHYCDVSIMRWQMLTGKSAFLEGLDMAFDEVAASQSI